MTYVFSSFLCFTIVTNSKIIKNDPSKLIIATSKKAPKAKIKKLQQKGVHILILEEKKGKLLLETNPKFAGTISLK